MKSKVLLEHINFTVKDADATAAMLGRLFDWRVRWSGESIHNGYTVHVGGDQQYIALYTPQNIPRDAEESYSMVNGLNHVGIVVDDLEEMERRIIKEGYKTFSHGDYEPGKRFYFREENNIEFELISYS